MTATAQPHVRASRIGEQEISQRWLLKAGIAGAALYPVADIFASARYPGYSYRDQAVSELFAIGAPTSALVVPLFTISSTLLLLFAFGIWRAANGRRVLQWMAVMMALNAIDALLLWNFFPMHMRGAEPTFTDAMHGLLAIDPFLLTAIILAAVACGGRFRFYTVATILFTAALAMAGFSYVTAVIANEPTPWMGATERAAQYATNLWYALFAVTLLRHERAPDAGLTTDTGVTRFALASGALSSLVYAAMLIVIPFLWTEYSSASQTVSELSAFGAPTRTLWVSLGVVWMLLYAAFGWGVWKTADTRSLRIAGGSIFMAAVIGIFWPPMHLREVLAAGGGTLSDTLHLVWTAMNAVLTLFAMVLAAAALGRRFRIYSIVTLVITLGAGFMTSLDTSRISANLPTPWVGAWERINIGAWLLWVAVLSVMLYHRPRSQFRRRKARLETV
jgi:hypothetical protein